MTEDFEIPSGDYRLSARLYLPSGGPRAAYVLHGATGVPRDYYARFAEWVAGLGFACLTYGYRSDGTDPAVLRASGIGMSDWGIHDQNAALNALADRFPGVELRVIGHSLGGFMTMFHDRADQVASLSAVCSGPAYWRRTPLAKLPMTILFWFLLGPASARVLGYLSPKVLGTSEPLPASAFHEWRQWCGNPDLHRPFWGKSLPQPKLDAFQGRLKLVGVWDDWMIAPPVVADLAGFYPSAAAVEFTEVTEDEADGPVGHLRIFRPRHENLWPRLL